jgi:predicted DNA-binding WGR domain protein
MKSSLTQLWKNPAKRRYYRVQIAPDLFGDLCLVRSWGSLDTARGNSKLEVLPRWQEAQRHLDKISKERARKGYQQIPI